LPEAEAIIIVKQLIRGYKYLHEHSVIHRDLKPANILIKDETYKIADFGFAKYYQEGAELDQIHQSLVGSPMYMCPEILNGSTYSTKSDVWSMGVIFYQMLYGKTPHKATSLEELISKVNKKIIRFPQKLSTPGMQ
jgi:serine/threonine-protein kinase ULK/ATG1